MRKWWDIRALPKTIKSVTRWLVPVEPEYQPKRWRRFYLLAAYTSRRWLVEDRCGGMAATLTISTLLSTVPLIGVALLVVGLMDPGAGAALMQDLFRSIVPETSKAEEMAQAALELASNVTIKNLGAWGFLVALSIAFVLFRTLERTFNAIWRATRKRSLLTQFTMFYTLATLGPFLILYSLRETLVPGVSTLIGIPFITSSLGLIALNRFLPFTEVKWWGPVVGGVLSALLLELGKFGFGFYATRFALVTYEGVYGSLAILPILIVWAYLSWLVVLLGGEVAFVIQRRRSIALQGYMPRYILDKLQVQRPTGRTAARLLLAICDHYGRRELGLTPSKLAERFGVGLDTVTELLTRLEAAGFVLEADRPAQVFIPGRPLEQIKIREVLAVFEHDQVREPRDDRLGDVFAELDAAREKSIGDLDFAELVTDTRREASESQSSPRIIVARDT